MNADGEKARALFENHEFLSFSVHPRLSAVEIIFQKKKMLPDCNADCADLRSGEDKLGFKESAKSVDNSFLRGWGQKSKPAGLDSATGAMEAKAVDGSSGAGLFMKLTLLFPAARAGSALARGRTPRGGWSLSGRTARIPERYIDLKRNGRN